MAARIAPSLEGDTIDITLWPDEAERLAAIIEVGTPDAEPEEMGRFGDQIGRQMRAALTEAERRRRVVPQEVTQALWEFKRAAEHLARMMEQGDCNFAAEDYPRHWHSFDEELLHIAGLRAVREI